MYWEMQLLDHSIVKYLVILAIGVLFSLNVHEFCIPTSGGYTNDFWYILLSIVDATLNIYVWYVYYIRDYIYIHLNTNLIYLIQ